MAITQSILFLILSALGVCPLPSHRVQSICPPHGEITVPHPTSCSKYISCANGTDAERTCQNGTIFNYEEGTCTDRNATTCDLCKFNTKPVQLLPFEGNCSKYIVCYGTSRVERDCADGFYFDSEVEECRQSEHVRCEYSSDGDDDQDHPNYPNIECRDNDQEEFVPSLDSCEEYFVCLNGTSIPKNCSDGLIFNIDSQRCSLVGHCLHDYEPTCEASGSFLPHLYECRHFFYCDPDSVQPLLQACKLGHLFDSSQLRCVPEGEATCSEAPVESLEKWPESVSFV